VEINNAPILEKRKFPRLKDNIFVFCRSGPTFSDEFKAITCDMSGGGLMFETERDITPESKLELEIYQPSVKYKDLIFLLSAQAKVIWVKKKEDASRMIGTNKYQIGMEFVKIEKEDKDRIIEYVKRIEKGW